VNTHKNSRRCHDMHPSPSLPSIHTQPLETTIIPAINFLKGLGLSQAEWRRCILLMPRSILYKCVCVPRGKGEGGAFPLLRRAYFLRLDLPF
jgi:hypothetical protein